jgi:hypothetical protein
LPYTKLDLPDVEEEKVLHLCHHGERLATAFSLINTVPGTPFQVKKICGFVERGIMVRNADCFHHVEMLFVLEWTIGDASSLSSQLLLQVHYCV